MTSPEETAGTDPVLDRLAARPFRIERPAEQRIPFVFASPHSGRFYPPGFLASSRLGLLSLRRSEDAYVDELFADAVTLGAPLIAAEFPRVYIDANRAPAELDNQMFEPALHLDVDTASPRVAAGLGVIPRIVRDGAEIYRSKLPPEEAQRRITRFYRPYHAALANLIEETFRRFGTAVVVDCHSMPSGALAPSIVFGDRHGASASAALLRQAETAFEKQGFTTGRNTPYAGGFTTYHYAQREAGIHTFQIEVNRGLYLDEEQVERGARFAEMRGRITAALTQLAGLDIALLRPAKPLAAE